MLRIRLYTFCKLLAVSTAPHARLLCVCCFASVCWLRVCGLHLRSEYCTVQVAGYSAVTTSHEELDESASCYHFFPLPTPLSAAQLSCACNKSTFFLSEPLLQYLSMHAEQMGFFDILTFSRRHTGRREKKRKNTLKVQKGRKKKKERKYGLDNRTGPR